MDSHSWESVIRGILLYLAAILTILGFAMYVDAPEQLYRITRRSEPSHPLSGILSSRSIDALESDQQLREVYASALLVAVASVSDLAARFPDVPQISAANDFLSTHYTAISTPSPTSSLGLTRRNLLSDFLEPIGDLFSGIADGISLQGPAFFLGIGIGEGVSQGLNLATADATKEIANRVIAANNETSRGLNTALQDAAKGAAATLMGSVSSSVDTLFGMDPQQLPKIVLAIGEGLGNGTASGLGLSERAKGFSPPQGTGISDLVGTFGFAVSKSVASNIDLAQGGIDAINQILGGVELGTVAMVAGEGIGNGTATGLGLSQHDAPATTGNSIVDAVGGFTYGLSRSLAGGLDLQNGLSLPGGDTTAGGFDIIGSLPSAFMGLGRGLSEGVGIGFGVESDVAIPLEELSDGQINIAGGVTRNFGRGLTAGFLENGTATRIISSLGAKDNGETGGLGGVDIGRVAQGLARGMLQGIGDGIDSVGGVQAIADDTATLPADMGAAMNLSLDFDDSVSGAASGLGLGMGNQGIFVAIQVANNLRHQTGIAARLLLPSRVMEHEPALIPRQETNEDPTTETHHLNVSSIITADAVAVVAQGTLDALTCQGIGGIASMVLGLMKSGILPSTALDTSIANNSAIQLLKEVIPEGTIALTNEGNTFGINLKQGIDSGDLISAVTVNETSMIKFVVFLVIHILVAIIVFLNVLPAAIGLEGARNILDRLKKHYVLPNSRRWVNLMWIFVIFPGSMLILLFGTLAMGSASHFRTPHGVLGIVTTIFTISATVLHYVVLMRGVPPHMTEVSTKQITKSLPMLRAALNQVLLVLAAITTLMGFVDLAAISICLVHIIGVEMGILAGFALAGVWSIGQAVSGLDGYMMVRERRQKRKNIKGGIVRVKETDENGLWNQNLKGDVLGK